MRIALLIGLISFLSSLLSSPLAHATVYAWKDDGGILYMSNDPGEVPEAARAGARSFTAKSPVAPSDSRAVAPSDSLAMEGAPAPPVASPRRGDAFASGFERGVEMSERQARVLGELASSLVRAVPVAQPVVIREPPAFVVRYVSPSYAASYAGAFPGCSPFWPAVPGAFTSSCAFGPSRFIPHSHFFPGTVGPRRGLFFPFGHATQNNGFLFGQGFLVD